MVMIIFAGRPNLVARMEELRGAWAAHKYSSYQSWAWILWTKPPNSKSERLQYYILKITHCNALVFRKKINFQFEYFGSVCVGGWGRSLGQNSFRWFGGANFFLHLPSPVLLCYILEKEKCKKKLKKMTKNNTRANQQQRESREAKMMREMERVDR